jgi:ubiquinone/menaquinone biosynthesis C-methylase UbiE
MEEMDYKELNKTTYDKYAEDYDRFSGDHIRNELLDNALKFANRLHGRGVLDIGSGPGKDSTFFKEHGLVPLCFDISTEMLKLCSGRGLAAMNGNLENLPFPPNSFDGVWAYASLSHMPKANLPPVLERIKEILRPEGMFYIGMNEGTSEGLTGSSKHRGVRRFLSSYLEDELKEYLSPLFNIVPLPKTKVVLEDKTFLNYLCEKK